MAFPVVQVVVIDVGMKKSIVVGTNPDVAVAVSRDAVDGVVNTDAAQSQLVAERGVPFVGVPVVIMVLPFPTE